MADDLTVNREGDMLVIRIPIKTATPSASGTTLVAGAGLFRRVYRPGLPRCAGAGATAVQRARRGGRR